MDTSYGFTTLDIDGFRGQPTSSMHQDVDELHEDRGEVWLSLQVTLLLLLIVAKKKSAQKTGLEEEFEYKRREVPVFVSEVRQTSTLWLVDHSDKEKTNKQKMSKLWFLLSVVLLIQVCRACDDNNEQTARQDSMEYLANAYGFDASPWDSYYYQPNARVPGKRLRLF